VPVKKALRVELTKARFTIVHPGPGRTKRVPAHFIAGDDGKSQQRFSLETPGGEFLRTCVLDRPTPMLAVDCAMTLRQ
jgi:hypothetical protein